MKKLKVETISYEFRMGAFGKSQTQQFDERVNEFLATLHPEVIYKISYLNSTGSLGERVNPKSVLIAIITYFEDDSHSIEPSE